MDLISVFANKHVPYVLPPHLRVRRGWVGVDCPKCSPGHNKYRLGFELSSGRSHCWMCGGFHPVEILAKVLRCNFGEAKEILKSTTRRVWHTDQPDTAGKLEIPKCVAPFLPIHEQYINGRGLDPKYVADTWGVQGIGIAPKLAWRLFIPIYDKYGRLVSWTTRAIGADVVPRYYSASPEQEEVSHKSVLYGGHLARHTVIVLEGPIDAWTIGRGAVATCGIGFSKQQLALMIDYPVRIVCFDNEPDAQLRAERLCNQLSLIPGTVENIVVETGKDPNGSDPREIQQIRERYFPELYRLIA